MQFYGSSLCQVDFIVNGHYSEVFSFQKSLFQIVFFFKQLFFWKVIIPNIGILKHGNI